jgi:hypothetical protein
LVLTIWLILPCQNNWWLVFDTYRRSFLVSLGTLRCLSKYISEKKCFEILERNPKNKMCHEDWRLRTFSSKDLMGLYSSSLPFFKLHSNLFYVKGKNISNLIRGKYLRLNQREIFKYLWINQRRNIFICVWAQCLVEPRGVE